MTFNPQVTRDADCRAIARHHPPPDYQRRRHAVCTFNRHLCVDL